MGSGMGGSLPRFSHGGAGRNKPRDAGYDAHHRLAFPTDVHTSTGSDDRLVGDPRPAEERAAAHGARDGAEPAAGARPDLSVLSRERGEDAAGDRSLPRR